MFRPRAQGPPTMHSKSDVVDAYDSTGLAGAPREPFRPIVSAPEAEVPVAPHLAAALAQVQELTAEVNRLRAERERWQGQQSEIMTLLASKSPDRILHDLRNVLNERELFRTLADLGT